jgi:hypothetical protein
MVDLSYTTNDKEKETSSSYKNDGRSPRYHSTCQVNIQNTLKPMSWDSKRFSKSLTNISGTAVYFEFIQTTIDRTTSKSNG